MSFLGNLSAGGAKQRVYLSVTPGVGLEMIKLDLTNNVVENYAVRDLAYDWQRREIADYETFASATSEMLQELGVGPKCEVVLNIPLVSFGKTDEFGLMVGNEAISGGLESNLEQSYIYQKVDPVVAWQDIPSTGGMEDSDKRNIIYAAIQQPVVDQISQALASVGATLIGIENSLVSTLRALAYVGCASTQMQPNMKWNLMIVNSIGYSIVSMSGTSIIDYYEEPIAFKSLEGDGIYDAIDQSAKIALMSSQAPYLFILSDTDQVSAALLASRMNSQAEVTVLENNSMKQQELIGVGLNVLQTYAPKISLQAIGIALADVSDYPLNLRFAVAGGSTASPTSCVINIGEKEYTITKDFAMRAVLMLGIIIVIPVVLLTYLLVPKMLDDAQNKLSSVNNDIKTIDAEIAKYKDSQTSSVFNVKSEVEKGIKGNRSKLMNYVAAGDAIPKTVWLTYFMTQGDGLVDMKGVSSNVSDVYVFFKNMRDSLIGTKLRLQKLEMVTQSVDDAVSGTSSSNYSFEITNMTTDQLSALMAGTAAAGNGQTAQQSAQQGNNSANNNNNAPQSGLLSQQPIQGN